MQQIPLFDQDFAIVLISGIYQDDLQNIYN